jgi:hypothetical protein
MWTVQVLTDLALHPAQLGSAPDLRQQDDEFISSVSACRVTHANAGQETCRYTFQNSVSGVVSKLVIHLLEVIQVDEENAHLMVLPCRLRDGLLESIQQQRPVGQSGQRIVIRKSARKRYLSLELLDLPAKPCGGFIERPNLAWLLIAVSFSAHACTL